MAVIAKEREKVVPVVEGSKLRKTHVFVCPFCSKIIIQSQRKGSGVKIWVMIEEVYEPRGAGVKAKRLRQLGSIEV